MPRITTNDVSVWFNDTTYKLELSDFLRETALCEEEVIGMLVTRFDVSGWTTPDNTPTIVKTAIAMSVAAWRYRILYTETTDQAMFARALSRKVKSLIEGMLDGSIAIDEEVKPEIKYFSPNKTTEPKPLFTMDMEF